MKGSGDFSIGSQVWPGTSKLIEEMGELQQVLGKLIATAGETKHWEGKDLKERLIEELADVQGALNFFKSMNLDVNDRADIVMRADTKYQLFLKWQKNPEAP
jgi:NTP pyrophosphatase (non-canonical NTP hydrolase)